MSIDWLKKSRVYRFYAEFTLKHKLSDSEFSSLIDEWDNSRMGFGDFLRTWKMK